MSACAVVPPDPKLDSVEISFLPIIAVPSIVLISAIVAWRRSATFHDILKRSLTEIRYNEARLAGRLPSCRRLHDPTSPIDTAGLCPDHGGAERSGAGSDRECVGGRQGDARRRIGCCRGHLAAERECASSEAGRGQDIIGLVAGQV